MIARGVLFLAIAIVAIAQAEQAQLQHAERVQACLKTALRIASPVERRLSLDRCSRYCPHRCQPGYICQYGLCVDRCRTMKCRAGYRCLHGKCHKVMGCGQRCDNPKWICAVGVSCMKGKCTGRAVGENGRCGGSSCNTCKAGTRCYKGRCRKVMRCGGKCDYPRWICPIGSFCSKGRCAGLAVGEGGKCGGKSCNTCKAGTRCYLGRCRKEMGCNQRCDYPKWICKPGLSCRGGKCQGRVVGENGKCGGSSCNQCKAGTRCFLGKCRKEMGCGQSCDYPKWICKAGLSCRNRKCVRSVVSEGQKCSALSCNACKPGTRCYGGVCRKVMGCGQKCDYPIWICGLRARCHHGRCKCKPFIRPLPFTPRSPLEKIP